jgi:glycosyltransferase involved in cell wall biosynthesis
MRDLSVDIITPSYNQAAYIGDTIKSVKNQTYEDITHRVIDGGSDDGTVDILKQYDNIDWVSEDDRGQTHAINKGFERADGDIVGWLNSDDPLVYQDTVETVVEHFSKTGADILVGHSITIGPDNELLRAHYIPEFDREQLKYNCYLFQPSIFFHSEVTKNNKLNEKRDYSMDYEYWLRLGGQDYEWAHAGEILSADRNHPERKIIAQADKSRADTDRLRQQYGIDQDLNFSLKQTLESIRLRGRRVRALPMQLELLNTPQERFAFDLRRQSSIVSMWTQLFGRKLSL